MYTVPNGANDDWYWMYSTIYPGRQNPAFVVTNDLMRDHKVSFLAPLPFVRWRTTQIVYYSIFRHLNYNATHHGFNNATAVLKVKPELRNSTVFEENLPVTVSVEVGSSSNSSNVKEEVSATNKTVVGSKPKGKNPIVEACIPPFNDMEGDGEVFLFGPGNFSREIQRSTFTDRWHIPASDSNLWLCLNTEERVARRNSSIPKHVHISSMDIHSNNEINSGSGIMV